MIKSLHHTHAAAFRPPRGACLRSCDLSLAIHILWPVAMVGQVSSVNSSPNTDPKPTKSHAEWRKQLTPEQFHVTREHGTERAFTGPYWNEKRAGLYSCVCCGAALFYSETKYDSGTGLPSFYAPVGGEAVSEHDDRSVFFRRTEVCCAACEAHLGHVFRDGPKPTGLRYCILALLHKWDRAEIRPKGGTEIVSSNRAEAVALQRRRAANKVSAILFEMNSQCID
jgi:peptide-methionine (R)-S-oxide reductase